MSDSVIFEPFTINGVRFRNRVLRSSVGGRMANYDGTVTDVWKNFEKRFADGGVGGIISTTFHVNKERLSPLQYPSIADPKYVPYLRKYIAAIKRDQADCRYIVQIGDPGYSTYTSLFPEDADAKSSSSGFDLAFGYNNWRSRMSNAEIEKAIRDFADAAARVQDAGADGIEITATKGYLIHQFLNPGINRRRDSWGGSAAGRFRFLQRILEEVRGRVGRGFLVGVRLSGKDFNASPIAISAFRIPWNWSGNDVPQMLAYAREMRALGVDYLHVVSGYGFPNPRDTPGRFPFDEVKLFFNSTRHLTRKAAFRAALANHFPFAGWLLGRGWTYEQGVNLPFARAFKQDPAIGLPVIANGGFQQRGVIERAIQDGGCDMVSMARALIANPGLLADFRAGRDPCNPCNYCNRCVGRTGTSPLGCYEPKRFGSRQEMMEQIMAWNRPDPA